MRPPLLIRIGGAVLFKSEVLLRLEGGRPVRDVSRISFLRHYLRLQPWNLLPNRRHALFFDIWAGHKDLPAFRRSLTTDLTALFADVAAGRITAPIDSVYHPLDQAAAAALRRAERGGLAGKILLEPATI